MTLYELALQIECVGQGIREIPHAVEDGLLGRAMTDLMAEWRSIKRQQARQCDGDVKVYDWSQDNGAFNNVKAGY